MRSLQTWLQCGRNIVINDVPVNFESQYIVYVCCRTDMLTYNLYVRPDMKVVDFRKVKKRRLILVVENVDETRAGIDTLLKANGYRVALASAAQEAINIARLERPDLILVSGSSLPDNVLVKVERIRKEAAVGDEVPVVVFCAQDVPEGEEVAIGGNVYLTNPDNFNQLRSLVAQLLPEASSDDVTDEEEQTLEIL